MGNPVMDDRSSAQQSDQIITRFYTSAAWIEGRVEDQLSHVSTWAGVNKIAAFPDLHPGKYGPVGCAVLADRIYPQLIGNDIGCGMSLFALDLSVRKLKLEKAARRMRALGQPFNADQRHRLEAISLPTDLFADALGTVGGGNHFCEVQMLADGAGGLDQTCCYLLVHSGSRGLGTATLSGLPEGAFAGLQGDDALTYVTNHNAAVAWAKLNRQVIAERAADALKADLRLITDAPHNILSKTSTGWLHRKGAAMAQDIVPIAGSRATSSFLVVTLGHQDALG